MSRTAYRVFGLDCADEIALLRREVGPVVGGEEKLAFDLLAGRMWVDGEVGTARERRILAAIESAGLRAERWRDGGGDGHAAARRRHTLFTAVSGLATLLGFVAAAAAGGGVLAALGLAEPAAAGTPPFALVGYLVAVGAGGALFMSRAWLAARRLRPDMNLLMAIAVLGAMALGDWLEAATVCFLFALSLALESWSVGRARRAIESLLDLAPPRAHRLDPDGSLATVDAATLLPGDLFVVKPGERVPADGEVTAGESEVDESPITGESLPVEKAESATLWAGTVNGRGALTARATKLASDTLLARILRTVAEAQERRAPAERFTDRFARAYTPAVLALAAAVALLPPLAGGDWATWIYRGLVLLVIGCPCALVISTPVAVVAGLAAAARQGVLLKGGAALEAAGRIESLAFDKTGTLTRGRPRVVEIAALEGAAEDELLALAAALESRSGHPIARAVVEAAAERGIVPPPVERTADLPGRGAEGRVGGRDAWLGSHRQVAAADAETPEVRRRLAELSGSGRTVVAIGEGDRVLGFLSIADEPRAEAAAAVARLRDLGVDPIVMITGDSRATAEAIAARLGIDRVEAELLPEEKLAAVESLLATCGTVAMVGDGVNDAPALARSSLGVAMGATASGAALETADAALLGDDLGRLPWLVVHARRTLAVIRANVAFALGVKALFFALALAGVATLWGAIAADMGASLLVIANALRLLRA